MWSSTQEVIIVEVSALGFEEYLPKTVESLVAPLGPARAGVVDNPLAAVRAL